MYYEVKISSETGKEIVFDCKSGSKLNNAFRNLSIKSDTPALNVKNRASNVLVRIHFEMEIIPQTKDKCRDLMEWSLISSGEEVYRTITVNVMDSKSVPMRSYKINEVFVEDYEEKFVIGEGSEDDERTDYGYFVLDLIQASGETENIKQDVDLI
ncbi:MAG: hypothetical protein IJ666_07505 [Ruminococcus sp.]|nr:hypothetical protein [Ruminococcus sp.]